MPEPGSEARRRARVLVALVAVGLVALFWRTRRARPEEPDPTPRASSSSIATTARAPANADEFPPEVPSSSAGPFPFAPPSAAKFEDVLARYQAFAIYPPWSRPHVEGTKYKLAWNEPVVTKLPFSDKPGRPVNYRFASDRAHVMAGQALTSWFQAWRGEDENQRLPIRVVGAWVMVTSGPTPGRAITLTYGDDGQNGDASPGDLVYTNRFVPSQTPELATVRRVQIMAMIEIEGIQKPIVRDFTFSSREPLTFGAARDRQENGGLTFEIDVDVHDAGEYTCEANLLSGDGVVAIGYAKTKPTLGEGPARLDFEFFGKMIRDRWLDGPYEVRDVRCVLRQAGDEENVWAADDGVHVTQPYAVDSFSDAEWKSPEKSARISMLQKLADEAKGGANPNPNAPQHIHVDSDGNEHVIAGPRASN